MRAEDLPDVYRAELDAPAYEALLSDLAALAEAPEVSVKEVGRAYVPERADWTLEAAKRALDTGAARAIQVRYVHDGSLWIDTIMRGVEGFRLVRMQASQTSA